MSMKSAENYREDMKKMKRKIYAYGEEIKDVVEHPLTKPVVNCIAETYRAASIPEFKDVMIAKSHVTGKETNIFNMIYKTREDLIQRCRVQRLMPRITGYCSYRCLGSTLLSALYDLTYEIDQTHQTEYHKRFEAYVKYIEDNDLTISESMTDVKGDRGKRPSEQSDPDMHVHVVERKKDGIVIRGAKAHQSGAIASHEHIIGPTRVLRKGEEEFALFCAVPGDAKGIVHILQAGPEEAKILAQDSGNPKYGICNTSIVIFDNVFVPWERVFMCGEYEYTGTYIIERYSPLHRIAGSACKGGCFDILGGAIETLIQYNGLKSSTEHLRDKLTDLISIGEICYGTGIASAVLGYNAPSGIRIPDPIMGNASKIYAANHIYEAARLCTDMAGGLVATVPSWKDYYNPATKPYMDKYLKGIDGVPVENRIKLFKFIQTMISQSSMCPNVVLGAGTAFAGKVGFHRNIDLEHIQKFAKVVTGIDKEDSLPLTEYVSDLQYK